MFRLKGYRKRELFKARENTPFCRTDINEDTAEFKDQTSDISTEDSAFVVRSKVLFDFKNKMLSKEPLTQDITPPSLPPAGSRFLQKMAEIIEYTRLKTARTVKKHGLKDGWLRKQDNGRYVAWTHEIDAARLPPPSKK